MDIRDFKGTCLCGSISYFVRSRPRQFYFCHCRQCRKLTGSAFAANVLLDPAEIQWVKGKDKVKRFDYPGERMFSRVFCADCGSGLPFLNESGEALIIPAGSLDQGAVSAPDFNIFWADRAEWYEAGVSAPKCAAFPPTSDH